METTVVIPSDLKKEFANYLRSVLEFQPEQKMRLILLHGLYSSNSISELLFFDKSDIKLKIADKEFLKELDTIEKLYQQKIASVQIEFFVGYTQSSFNAYLEAMQVDKVLIPSNVEMDWSNKRSMDIMPFIQKCEVEKHFISIHTSVEVDQIGFHVQSSLR